MSFTKTLLITGGAGFIGSNFIHYCLSKHPSYRLVNLDQLTYAGDLAHLSGVMDHPHHLFIQGDINDRALLQTLFQTYAIEGVIHFAAESHVDNSIANPDIFWQTNVLGTLALLDTCRQVWKEGQRFHHVSTDEVFGTLGETGYFTERSPYAPNSPYSASKASSDLLVRSYIHTYGMNLTLSNCSNNYGPRQHAEKLIPTVIRKALSGQPIPIYGQGRNVRDWLYVDDHCRAIDWIYHQGQLGEGYVIGGENELDNLSLAEKICELLDRLAPTRTPYKNQIQFVSDRPGHDFRYAVDCTKLKQASGWSPSHDFSRLLEQTIRYYLR